MKLTSIFLIFFSSTVFAGYEGKFECANRPGLPDNTYSIQFTELGNLGTKVPYIVGERYYRQNSDANSPIKKATISGFAAVSESETDKVLMIGSLRLEIVDDRIKGCKKVSR